MPDTDVVWENSVRRVGQGVADNASAALLLPPSLLEVEHLVGCLMASWQPGNFAWERRHGHRTRFDETILLTPVDERSDQPCGEPYSVKGKDISPQGLSFLHEGPLPHRNVRLSIPLPTGLCATLILRLNWCRFTSNGLYESGGKFLRAVLGETAEVRPAAN